MEKLPMCRLCLAENVRMYVVVNKDLHELYERLTDNPFVTGDSRPMLACFICCTKLKQCCQLQRKCLEAEELLTQMMNEDYELSHIGCFNELIISPTEHVSIESDFECQTECDAIKEELPDVCERLDDVTEPEEEHQSDDLERENSYNSFMDAEDIPAQQSVSDSKDNIPLVTIKTEVEEEQEALKKKRKVREKLYKCEECQRCFSLRSNLMRHILMPTCKKSYKCEECQRCFDRKSWLTRHIRMHTGEKPFKCEECQRCFTKKGQLTQHIRTHTGEKPFKCEECLRCFSESGSLTKHIRTHTGEKPYKCGECLRCFSERGSLLRHIRTHSGRPYKCDECQRCFRVKSRLKAHILTHTKHAQQGRRKNKRKIKL